MCDDLKAKLTDQLSGKPIDTEAKVVYLLVQIRKLLELDDVAYDDCKLLKFYCNWAVHPFLGEKKTKAKSMAQLVVEEFSTAISVGADISKRIQNLMSFTELRNELYAFLERHKLPTTLTKDFLRWSEFVNLYTHVISDCPLVYRSEIPLNIDKVVFSRVDSNGNRPHVMVILPLEIRCEARLGTKVVETVTMTWSISDVKYPRS
jgi:hypothetical protein